MLAACLLAALRRQVDIIIYSLKLEVGDDALLHHLRGVCGEGGVVGCVVAVVGGGGVRGSSS